MNNLKALSKSDNDLIVANHIILFGGQDLSGEFFTKNTEVKSTYTDLGVLYVDFEHGFDVDDLGNDQNNVLGVVDWKTAKIDDKGIFVERVLNRRSDYVQYVEELIDAGLMGTSSQAAHGKTVKRSNGEIIEWPLMRDSLTVTPMEPRMLTENTLSAAKSLIEFFPESKSLKKLIGIKPRTVEEIEDFKSAESCLRDLGMSRTEAVTFMAKVKSLKQSDSVGIKREIDDLRSYLEQSRLFQ